MRTALAAGDQELAGRLLGLVSEVPAGDLTPALRAPVLVLRGELAVVEGADPAQIDEDLAAGVAAFEAYGSPPELARARATYGRWLHGQNRPTEAEPLLVAARDTFAELGATAWLTQLSGLLPATSAPVP
jgi:hypothetical protein